LLAVNEARPDAPEDMPQFTYTLKLVIMLKSGAARGRHELKVVPELPSGETLLTRMPFRIMYNRMLTPPLQ